MGPRVALNDFLNHVSDPTTEVAESKSVTVYARTSTRPLGRRNRWILRRFPRRWQLRFLMWRVDRAYRKAHAIAQREGQEALDTWSHVEEFTFDIYPLEEEYEVLETRRLLRKATRNWLDVPEYPWHKTKPIEDDTWKYAEGEQSWYLRPSAKRKLRDALRAERKSRYEEIRMWLPTIISVISTAIAVYAVLHGRK